MALNVPHKILNEIASMRGDRKKEGVEVEAGERRVQGEEKDEMSLKGRREMGVQGEREGKKRKGKKCKGSN